MKTKTLITFFLITFNSAFVAYSQKQGQELIDSLSAELPKINSDSSKINLWNSLAANYGVINPDTGLIYANLALNKSKEINWIKGEVNALINIGTNYYRKNICDKALNFLYESINKNAEIHDSAALILAYHTIGMTYYILGDNEKALKYCQDELRIAEASNNKEAIPNAYLAMGNIFSNLNKYKESLNYNEMVLRTASLATNKRVISYAYSNSGTTYQKLNQFSKALIYHFKALKIEEEMGDIYGIGTEYGSISDAYRGIYNEQKKKNRTSDFLLDSVIFFANKGIEFCKKCDDLLDVMNITFSLSEAYKLKNDHKKALEVYEEASILKDSIFSADNQKKIREVEAQEQANLNEKEIELLNTQKKLQRNYFLFGGVFLSLLSIGIFSRLQATRKTKRQLEEKNKIITIEKKRSDELLLNILPSEVAEELKSKGSADAKQFTEVTVMFTDFKNFTHISERLSPSQLVAEIDTCFKAFDNIITKYNIEKIKTIGDSYMCAGGLPVVNKTNATDVVNAALEIQQFMQKHLQQRKNENKEPFEIRIGVHTGPVVAGIVGIKKFAYDIWGDTVNIASRMESSGEAGKVNISGSTYDLVKGKFNCSYRGKIQAKNKGEIDMYFVENIL